MSPNRFHTVSIGPDEEALRIAFQKCGALLQERGCTAMGLAVHTKNNLDGVVQAVFGVDVIRVLDRYNRLDLKGITLHLLTEKIQLRKPGRAGRRGLCQSRQARQDRLLFRCDRCCLRPLGCGGTTGVSDSVPAFGRDFSVAETG
jgi:hypothetical protein